MENKEKAWDLINRLPKEPSESVKKYLQTERPMELSRECLIYNRQSFPDDAEGWLYENWLSHSSARNKNHWGSYCICTACGEHFEGGWESGNLVLTMSEDGGYFPGATQYVNDAEKAAIEEGDRVECPFCGTEVQAIRANRLKNDKKYTALICELQNIGSTTVLIYWLATRILNRYGFKPIEIIPREAIAVTPSGNAVRFSKTSYTMTAEYEQEIWQSRSWADPDSIPYHNIYNGDYGRRSINSYKIKENLPDMTGTTGEKTGIEDYIKDGGQFPARYLKLWRKHRNAENLVRSGSTRIIDAIFPLNGYEIYTTRHDATFKADFINWNARKPDRMLYLNKEDYREFLRAGAGKHTLDLFHEYREQFPCSFDYFWNELCGGDDDGEKTVKELKRAWGFGAAKVLNYLRKQEEHCECHDIVTFYTDYLEMLRQLNETTTTEQAFPRDLFAAHERASDAIHARKLEKSRADFRSITEKIKPLEWSDGKFCIVIPECAEDLTREGTTLHHCVGGYSSQHMSGKCIFFVRKARTPERSYFTLNEDINGEQLHRIQLHGYKNEYTNGKRLHIPQDVLDFVAKWETEILEPWLRETNRKNNIKNKENAA